MGVVSYLKLGVDLFPNVEIPVVTVITTLKGASVEEMETSVTKSIEEIVNTVSGIDELRSTTKEGISMVTVQFDLKKDRDVAAQEVRDKISTILAKLPVGTDPPIIDKFDINAMPVITIAVSGGRPMQEVTEIARKSIKEQLEGLSGVGAVILVGGRPRAVNVYVDPDKLASYGLSIDDARQALMRQNVELPGGRVDQASRELVLRTMGRLDRAVDFLDLIVSDREGYPVRIKDVGRVEDTFEEPRSLARLDGENAVSLVVQKQSGANTVDVVQRVGRRLDEIKEFLPPDIRTFVVKSQAPFIVRSVHELNLHLVIAAVLVAATIMLFIQDWRTTIIASLAIPASLVTTYAFMEGVGYTLNNITMLGLILAIGIVIDDAVVINENIFRHMEEHGADARTAASTATREIALAVSATTMSLLVIFLPVVFMGGRIGMFFSSFGGTVAFAIFMSLFVSFTLTPMLCSRFLKMKPNHGSKANWVWRAIDGSYGWMLRWSLRHRWVIVLASVGLLASIVPLVKMAGFDFVPRDDQSEFEVAVAFREGCTLEQSDKYLAEMESQLRTLRGVTGTFVTLGDTTGRVGKGQGDVTSGTIYCRMEDLEGRQRTWYTPQFWLQGIFKTPEPDPKRYFSQFDVQRDARATVGAIVKEKPDVFRSVAVQDVSLFSGSGFRQSMIDLNLRGPDLVKLQQYSESITQWMRRQAGFVDIDTSLSLRKPELRVKIDRERASDLGLPVATIASTLNVLVGGEPVSKFKEFDEQYDVWLRADLRFRDSRTAISRLMVRSPKAGLVELSSLAGLAEEEGPATIDRFSMQRQVVITANLADKKALGDAVGELTAYVRSLELPATYHFEFIGRAKMLGESNRNFLIAFLASFVFMYMILAAQFESFVHPITILLALPLTIPFALISLLMLRTNLDIYAMFGLFMLFGIVKKNGILQIDYTNVLRGRGVPRDEAILEANHTRLRPILMTTVMLIAAMIPIALGQGPGAASRASLAKVILGGQTLSLLLTLLVTPVAYSLWDDLGRFSRAVARSPWRLRDSSDPHAQREPAPRSGEIDEEMEACAGAALPSAAADNLAGTENRDETDTREKTGGLVEIIADGGGDRGPEGNGDSDGNGHGSKFAAMGHDSRARDQGDPNAPPLVEEDEDDVIDGVA
jgi:HAE1 family hydrophobic/amphiphilic exporter-1